MEGDEIVPKRMTDDMLILLSHVSAKQLLLAHALQE